MLSLVYGCLVRGCSVLTCFGCDRNARIRMGGYRMPGSGRRSVGGCSRCLWGRIRGQMMFDGTGELVVVVWNCKSVVYRAASLLGLFVSVLEYCFSVAMYYRRQRSCNSLNGFGNRSTGLRGRYHSIESFMAFILEHNMFEHASNYPRPGHLSLLTFLCCVEALVSTDLLDFNRAHLEKIIFYHYIALLPSSSCLLCFKICLLFIGSFAHSIPYNGPPSPPALPPRPPRPCQNPKNRIRKTQ